MSETTELLGQVPLFKGLPQEYLENLAQRVRRVSFAANHDIVEIGTPGRSLFLILEGYVRVLYPARNSDFELARLGPGEFFGEMALLNDKPRSATVRSVDGVTALALDKRAFRQAVQDHPELGFKVLEAMSVRIRNADEQISTLSDQAILDPLTGLNNRRSFQERVHQELDRARRYQTEFSILLLDLDGLKHTNDALGHDVGDAILVWVARILGEHTRASDVVFRLGGEEFAVLFPATGSETTRIAAGRLVGLVGQARPPLDHEVRVTMSAGYASYPGHGRTLESLYKVADRALFEGKRRGGGQVGDPPAPREEAEETAGTA